MSQARFVSFCSSIPSEITDKQDDEFIEELNIVDELYFAQIESSQSENLSDDDGVGIAESMNKSSRNGHNISQLVKDIEKPVIFYDWKKYLQQYFKTLKHISTYHHFIVDSTKPGYVVFKESCDSVPITINLLKKNTRISNLLCQTL
ncbi:Hypothetical predicted protein [Mytilus galloprovincialis]|uniref:Uncharacterized protein n=1 Tax=Mytilus galloprovincialis TaxID=29158 RepID=A0A8B6CFH1_MYTGA|nr:Hypothetical predicted protein [Mytilus galloprovincialis]